MKMFKREAKKKKKKERKKISQKMTGSVTLEILNLKFFYLLAPWTNPENKFSHESPFPLKKRKKLLQKKPALCSYLISSLVRGSTRHKHDKEQTNVRELLQRAKTKTKNRVTSGDEQRPLQAEKMGTSEWRRWEYDYCKWVIWEHRC